MSVLPKRMRTSANCPFFELTGWDIGCCFSRLLRPRFMIFFFRAVNTSAPYRKSLWVCGKRHVETHMLPLDNEGGNEQLSLRVLFQQLVGRLMVQ